jgi:RNA polymerase sigma-70 factor, ECF subfamily
VSDADEELVSRYLDGDEQAFAALVKRHEDRVFNVCLRIVGNREDALDASQDAFLSMLRKLSQFRGEAAFTTWLHRVVVNACYDNLRKRKRQPMLRLASEEGVAVEAGPQVPDPADEVSDGLDVAAALGRVPEEFRVALVLAEIEDLPYEEISRILDVPVGTVKSRVHRGRVALARALGMTAGASAEAGAGAGAGAEDLAARREPEVRSATSEEER